MKNIFAHPLTRKTRLVIKSVVITCAVILAVAFVTTLSVDLGPVRKARAEKAASDYMQRPMHIGRLSVHLWRGQLALAQLPRLRAGIGAVL